jgi:hypothetical protein
MPLTVELARFTVKPDEEEAFLALRAEMSRAARESFEGLVDETLVRLEDGSYLSIWTWTARRFCERAMARVDQVPAVASWLAHMEDDVAMDLGVVVDSAVGS